MKTVDSRREKGQFESKLLFRGNNSLQEEYFTMLVPPLQTTFALWERYLIIVTLMKPVVTPHPPT